MKVSAKSYPHPVLGNEDDLGGFFNVDFNYELGKDEVILNPSFSLRNSAIEDLIKKSRASFVAEVECGATFFRKSFSSTKPSERIVIPAKMLRERVTVGFYLCADQNIPNYKSSDPHPDYEGAVFDIEAGDVLAMGGYISFTAEKNFDPLRPPVSSFMSIMEGSYHEGPIDVDYETDKIMIILSKIDWMKFADAKKDKAAVGIIHASIVFPVLIDAINQVQAGNSDYENYNWFGRLEDILTNKGLMDKEPLQAAQKILDNPASRSFNGISLLLEIPSEQEYE